MTYAKIGDYDTAIKYYKESLRISPNNSTTRSNMGIALNKKGLEYYDSGDFDKTVQYLEDALRYKPNDQTIKANLREAKASQDNAIGIEYFNKEDYEMGLQYFKQALQYWPDDTTIQKNIRDVEAELKEQREKQSKERKLAESKTKVKQMLDNMSEEFGSSTLPTGSLGFMNPRKPLIVKDSQGSSSEGLQFMDPRQEEQKREGLQFKNSETPKKLRPMKRKLKKQEDYYKTLQVRDIPKPKSTQPPKSVKIVTQEDEQVSKLWRMVKDRSFEFQGDVSQWVEKQKQSFREWTYGETFDQTFGHFPGVSKFKSLKEEVEQQFDDMSGIRKNWLNRGMEGAREGSQYTANPYDDGTYADDYYDGIDVLGRETQDKARKMIKENIKSHLE